MHDAALQSMADPDIRRQLQNLGATIVSSDRTSPDYLRHFVMDEIAK